MEVMFINPDDCILELGGNIGRNSCVIGTILKDSNNLLVIESDPLSVLKLKIKENYENKRINALKFKIDVSAISKIPLIQNEWNTKPQINDVPEDWKIVNTITWNDLNQKYIMNFNVLVVDCEGAIDLSLCPLKTNVDTSLNNIISTKQDDLLFTSPILKDVSNDVTIDLSYVLKPNLDLSLNDVIQNKII